MSRRRAGARWRLLALATGALVVTVVAAVLVAVDLPLGSEEPPAAGAGRAATTVAAPAHLPAVDVLRRWDRRRAQAFAAGDVDALRRLYVPGSGAGAADVAVLAAYVSRGLRVEGMRMQVLGVDVLEESPGVVRVRVTDRLASAFAVDALGRRVRLPRDAASRRVVELRRRGADGEWRVAEVRESGPRPGAR